MGTKRVVFLSVGLAQNVVGIFATIFAYVLYHNYFEIRTALNVPQKDVSLFMLVLIIFGLLSIISGSFLINEK